MSIATASLIRLGSERNASLAGEHKSLNSVRSQRTRSQRNRESAPAHLLDHSTSNKLILQALSRSKYPLQRIDCYCDEQSVLLTGTVSRYHYIQMAIEVVRPYLNGRRIENCLKVCKVSNDESLIGSADQEYLAAINS